MTVRARADKQQDKRGRRRARTTVRILTGVCALAALGIGATQLASNGLQTFLDRPAGVGASPAADEAPGQATPPRRAPSRAPNNGARSGAANAPSPDAPYARLPDELGPVSPEPRGERPRPGFPRPDGVRHHPPEFSGPRRGTRDF